jgi:hypothetical protein
LLPQLLQPIRIGLEGLLPPLLLSGLALSSLELTQLPALIARQSTAAALLLKLLQPVRIGRDRLLPPILLSFLDRLLPPILLPLLALNSLELTQLAPFRSVQPSLLLKLFQSIGILLCALYCVRTVVRRPGLLLLSRALGAAQIAKLAPLGTIEPTLLLQAANSLLYVLLIGWGASDGASLDRVRLPGLLALNAHLAPLGAIDPERSGRGALEGRRFTTRHRHPRRRSMAHRWHLPHCGSFAHGRGRPHCGRGPRHGSGAPPASPIGVGKCRFNDRNGKDRQAENYASGKTGGAARHG